MVISVRHRDFRPRRLRRSLVVARAGSSGGREGGRHKRRERERKIERQEIESRFISNDDIEKKKDDGSPRRESRTARSLRVLHRPSKLLRPISTHPRYRSSLSRRRVPAAPLSSSSSFPRIDAPVGLRFSLLPPSDRTRAILSFARPRYIPLALRNESDKQNDSTREPSKHLFLATPHDNIKKPTSLSRED